MQSIQRKLKCSTEKTQYLKSEAQAFNRLNHCQLSVDGACLIFLLVPDFVESSQDHGRYENYSQIWYEHLTQTKALWWPAKMSYSTRAHKAEIKRFFIGRGRKETEERFVVFVL